MTTDTAARFAVVGNPIAHSQSPFIHQAFAAQTGITLSYERILAPLDSFEETIKQFFSAKGCGLNVTVPFKQEAWKLARSHLSARATRAAAVNTLWMSNGLLHGCNTDGAGLLADLERLGHPPTGKRVLLLGAGGAARGAIPDLLESGCNKLHIANRTSARAEGLANDFSDIATRQGVQLSASGMSDTGGPWDIVINATSSSLDAATAFDIALDYAPAALAYDMAYGTTPTIFMQQARQQGAQVCADGLGMLVSQAAVSFEIWHGVRPNPEPVLAALRARLNSDNEKTSDQ